MQPTDIETGTVLKTEGGFAVVVTNKSKSCNECGKAQAGICGKGGAGMVMKVRNPLGAEKGSTVSLGIDKNILLKGYLFVFIIPVIALLFSTFAGSKVSDYTGTKGLDVIAGFTGLVISLFFSFRKIRKLDKSAQLCITGILRDCSEIRSEINLCPEEMDYLSAFGRNN